MSIKDDFPTEESPSTIIRRLFSINYLELKVYNIKLELIVIDTTTAKWNFQTRILRNSRLSLMTPPVTNGSKSWLTPILAQKKPSDMRY